MAIRRILFLFLHLSFYAQLLAMDLPAPHPNIAINSSISDLTIISTRQHDALLKKISSNVFIYKTALYNSLGCACCKGIKQLFSTDQYVHVQKRSRQLKHIEDMIAKPMWMPHEVSAYIKKMGPFTTVFGNDFSKRCLKSIDKYIKSGQQMILENHQSCVICAERIASVLYEPCGHKLYCKNCFDDLGPQQQGCCGNCKADTKSHIFLKHENTRNLCVYCGQNKANIYFSCGHLVICSTCLDHQKPVQCPMCLHKVVKALKVIATEPAPF